MARTVGYARVSTSDQKLDLQLEALAREGILPRDIYKDAGISGAKASRPGLDAMLAAVVPGDSIIVWRLDRLGRNLRHLINLSQNLVDKGIRIRSLSDGVDTNTPTGKLMLGLLGTIAEYERETILERVHAGVAVAKAFNKLHPGTKYKGRKPLSREKIENRAVLLRMMLERGRSMDSAAKAAGLSRASAFRMLRRATELGV